MKTTLPSPQPATYAVEHLTAGLEGWWFPAFVLALLAGAAAVFAALLWVPRADAGLGAFAETFRVWCFGFDPATGRFQAGFLAMLLIQPLLLGTIVTAVWWVPLRTIWTRRRVRLLQPLAAAVVLIASGFGATVALYEPEAAAGDLPFPAEALRTHQTPPVFTLIDQHGASIELASLRGRVVAVTGVYASCGFACPMIFAQTRRVLAQLSAAERDELSVLAITLDPERDTPDALRAMAATQQVAAPLVRLLGGDPPLVNGVLDRFDISRRRDPATGVIDHASVFILLDRHGEIAYRFSLGDQQERWLVAAIKLLLRESGGNG